MSDLQIMLRRFCRVMLWARVVEAAMRGAIIGGVVAAVIMFLCTLDWWGLSALDYVSSWMIPVVLLIAGGLCGAGIALWRGVSESQAARWLDWRYGLKEHLSTASELLRAGDESPEAEFVYAQATQAARTLPKRLDVWRCTRRTPAMLLLTVLLCGALLLLPTREERLADQLLAADARQQDAIKANLRQAAGLANPDIKPLLSELVRVIEVRDEAELARILEKLRRAGFDVHNIYVKNIADASSAITANPQTPGRGQVGETTPEGSSWKLPQVFSEKELKNQTITKIYHPDYTSESPHPSAESFPTGRPIPGKNEPIQAAWRQAQAQAARVQQDTPIPPHYRSILQTFCRR